jgi:uncharacterized membrane protein YhfC
MLIAAYLLSVSGMIVLPIVLAFYLTRKFKLSWKLVLAGALTFIASQVLHLPLVYGLTALFKNGALPAVPQAWTLLFNAILLGLLAGIFEETARWILYKFILKNVSTWNEGLLVGVGHGGIEAVFIGFAALASVAGMIAMRNADLSAMGIPADQVELAKQQVAQFWSMPVYMAFLGLVERVFALCLHLVLSVMVLYSLVGRKPIWFWIALLWHAVVDGLTVYLLPSLGALGIEAVIGVCAVISLLILFRMRILLAQEQTISLVEDLGQAGSA